LLLNLIDNGDNNLVDFAKKSMITGDLQSKMNQVLIEIEACNKECDRLKICVDNLKTPLNVVKEYNELQLKKDSYVNKKRKEMEKEIQKIKDIYQNVEQDQTTFNKYNLKQTELNELQTRQENIDNYINDDVNKVLNLLEDDGFIQYSSEEKASLTLKGKMASQLREVQCLVFSRLLEDKSIDHLSSKQLVSLFSCFTNISVEESVQDFTPYTDDKVVKDVIGNVAKLYNEYEDIETSMGVKTGSDYYIQYDLLNYVVEWCDAECVEDCKLVLQNLAREKGVFLGEFVKALLKINNISCEMEKIAELTGNIAFLSKLREIPNLTLKYVVTNQSLYV
jgi:superfamily II RNA helicase